MAGNPEHKPELRFRSLRLGSKVHIQRSNGQVEDDWIIHDYQRDEADSLATVRKGDLEKIVTKSQLRMFNK